MKKIALAAGLAGAAVGSMGSVATCTDRAAFQAAAGGITVDTLTDVAYGGANGANRGVYSDTIQSFGVRVARVLAVTTALKASTYPGNVWPYSSGSFNLTSSITAFGLDFGDYNRPDATVTLTGDAAPVQRSGFLGMIDTAGFLVSELCSSGQ